MDTPDDFYLILPSSSSMAYFADNATTCFTTQLCREIKLRGDWVVGLAEIHIPCTVMHIQESEVTFKVDLADGKPAENNGLRYFSH